MWIKVLAVYASINQRYYTRISSEQADLCASKLHYGVRPPRFRNPLKHGFRLQTPKTLLLTPLNRGKMSV